MKDSFYRLRPAPFAVAPGTATMDALLCVLLSIFCVVMMKNHRLRYGRLKPEENHVHVKVRAVPV